MWYTPIMDGDVILSGVVGSRAYGLAHEDSDYDRIGIFVAPTEKILGLSKPKETYVSHDPDVTYHEIGKYLTLSLNANPTVLEAMFLEEHEALTSEGAALVEIRHAFLSNRINDSFGGYAHQQFERLKKRGDGSFSSTLRARTSKHAMHMARLLEKGTELKTTGDLQVKVRDPEKLRAVSRMSVDELIEWYPSADEEFRNAQSVLPDEPNYDIVEKYLIDIRKAHWNAN